MVIEGGTRYSMELQHKPQHAQDQTGEQNALDAAEFRVVQSIKTDDAGKTAPAVLKNNLLRIPVIRSGGINYRVELRGDGDAKLFKVISFVALNEPGKGYAALPDGRGGYNFESVVRGQDSGFDMARSLQAFQQTLYPYLSSNACSGCHNTTNTSGAGAQAPIHTDANAEVAHQYALTRVNFADPANSKLVVRMRIDRHHCPKSDCASAAKDMQAAIEAWKARIADMLPEAPRLVPANVKVKDAEVEQWIAADRAQLPAADRDYIMYTSMHELHNEGLSAEELNIVRVALSKALNSTARWAPRVVNPVDVNGRGLLYKFDIRDYWGWNKGVSRLLFGGSDDDLAFGRNKRDYRGNLVDAACSASAMATAARSRRIRSSRRPSGNACSTAMSRARSNTAPFLPTSRVSTARSATTRRASTSSRRISSGWKPHSWSTRLRAPMCTTPS